MEKTKDETKGIYATIIKLMNRYIIFHFYAGILPIIFSVVYFSIHIEAVHKYEITEEYPFSVMVFLSAVMFIPAFIWFVLTKYIKNIKRYITTIFFILFICSEVILCDIMLMLWAWRI